MPSQILGSAEIARNRFILGEIEAGLVFAAAAIEFQHSNPTRCATCHADAQDCYATAIDLMRQGGSMRGGWPLEIEEMLQELQRRLGVLRGTKLVSSAAA
ncbi:MAG TPA: hypothetical protein VMH81_19160 [Bryobacteraceae bacterium]|nr:hypothetical protein [Bryobacteraceae bacterium]